MTDYYYDRDYVWSEDNSALFNLLINDSLTIGVGTQLRSLGMNSPIARMQSHATIRVYEDAHIEAKDTAFYAAGGDIAFQVSSASWITAEQGYALYINGLGNSIGIGPYSVIASGFFSGGSEGAAIFSGGFTTIDNWGEIGDASNGTGIKLRDPENAIVNHGVIAGGKSAIDINGDNNTIWNSGYIEGRSLFDAAIYIREADLGTNVINNTGAIVTGTDPAKYGLAIHTEGNSRDTFNNGSGDASTGYVGGYVRGNINLGDDSDTLTNSKLGRIVGDLVLGSEDDFLVGEDALMNLGTITGDIWFGNGNDRLDNQGPIIGNVYLGSGDDILVSDGLITGNVELGDGNDYFVNTGTVGGRISGGDGADKISGGYGNDTISGGAGSDFLSGGSGSDVFVFDADVGLSNVDTIADFDTLEDKIQLSSLIFKALQSGQLTPDAFCLGSRPQDLSDRIGCDVSTGTVWYDPDGAGVSKTVVFAKLSPGLALGAENFFVV